MKSRVRLLSLGALLVVAFPLSRTARPVVVVGNSMSPTYRSGQVVWMRPYRSGMAIHTGDVVVFRHDGAVAIKRVAAASGTQLTRFRFQDGVYLLEDEMSPRVYASLKRMRGRGTVVRDDLRVPADSVYAVGDNRNVSYDSRDFGPVALADVMGVIPGKAVPPRDTLVALAP